jgi:hypothetical protein
MSLLSRHFLLSVTLLCVASTTHAQSVWVAAAARTAGVGDSVWRTDVGVLNSCPDDVSVEARLHTSDAVLSQSLVIPGGQLQVLEDVVSGFTDEEVTGALELVADSPIAVTSRTFNQAATGTFGQSLDGVTSSDGLSAGDSVSLQPLREDSAFRTNIGALNMGSVPASVSVTLLDALGAVVGSFELEVPAGRTVQDNRPYLQRLGRSDIAAGYALVTVQSGDGVWVYASVVDGATGDPTTITSTPAADCPLDIADRLAAIDGSFVIEIPTGTDGYRYFVVYLWQPEDHDDPGAAEFRQFITLLHRSEDAPMVLLTEGYTNSWGDRRCELTRLLGANQLAVEHRFFSRSTPASGDWSLLDIRQAAADHHRVVEAFRPIYGGVWINTGFSKGGMTAVYHRRFYPDDVDVTVPYVAPISYGAPDERYLDFLANVGNPACNEGLWAIQREALLRRDVMVPRVAATGNSYDRVGGPEAAFESVVVELPFTFWQYSGVDHCDDIPPVSASDDVLYDFIDSYVGFSYASDAVWAFFEPYYYQAHTELGFPAVATAHLADLLETDVIDPEEGVLPEGVGPVTHDPTVMADIAAWVASEGERLLFVYGEWDPWTGGAFELGDAEDSFLFVDPAGTHGADIGSLTPADQAEVYAILERWTGVTPDPSKVAAAEEEPWPLWRRRPPVGRE